MGKEGLDGIIAEFNSFNTIMFSNLIEWETALDDPYDRIRLYDTIVMDQLLSTDRKLLEEGLVGYIKGQQINAINQSESLAVKDKLTGIINIRGYDTGIERIIRRARRNKYSDSSEMTVGFIFIDLKKFKDMNDTHGHKFGDDVLRYVGEAIGKFTRTTDLVARYGGDEFVIVLDPLKRKESTKFLRKLNEKINSYVQSRIKIEHSEKRVNFRVDMGMALYGGEATTEEEIKRRADNAMFYAKNHPINNRLNYHVYDPSKEHLYVNKQDRKGR